MLSWHSQLKQKADLIHTNANIWEPRAQTRLLTDTRDRNCCDPVRVIVMGRSVSFKDQTMSFADGSVRNTGPAWRMALYCVAVKSVSCCGVHAQTHPDMDADLHLRTHRNNHDHKEPVSGQPAWPIDSAALLPALCAPGLLTVWPFICYWWVRNSEQPGQPVWPTTPAFTLAHSYVLRAPGYTIDVDK